MTIAPPPKCLYCTRPATVALRGKNDRFDIYLCWTHLIRNMRDKLKVRACACAERERKIVRIDKEE